MLLEQTGSNLLLLIKSSVFFYLPCDGHISYLVVSAAFLSFYSIALLYNFTLNSLIVHLQSP